jgi:hypothetical protein
MAQSTWKKSTASMVEACAHRNCRHDVSVDRSVLGYPPPREDPADRGCADAMAELAQLALDTLVAPAWFSLASRSIRGSDRVADGWATATVRVGPLLGHQATVPP